MGNEIYITYVNVCAYGYRAMNVPREREKEGDREVSD
jgi:hypothetical protein